MAPIQRTDLDLAKCFSGEQQLISWEIAYSALCDPDTASKSQPLHEFLTAEENLNILSTPWKPFPPPSAQEKSRFESATAPISVTPTQTDHYNLEEIKEDSLWLSNEAQISEYAALRLVVQEWQSRPTTQLLSGLTEEEALSVQEAAGIPSLGASTFVPNSSIANPTALGLQSGSSFDSPDQRKLRLFETYFSTCASILRVSQLLMAWGAARRLRTSPTTRDTYPDYRVADNHFEELGETIAASQSRRDNSSSDAPALDKCVHAFKARLDALDRGCTWSLPESIEETASVIWVTGHTTQMVHVLHVALFHADLHTNGFVPSPTVDQWFETFANVGFFIDFPAVTENQQSLTYLVQVLTSLLALALLKPQKVFEDLNTGLYEKWAQSCYILDGGLIERITGCLVAAAELGPGPAIPAAFAWAAIVWRLTEYAQALEEQRDHLLEVSPDSRDSLQAPSRLEEAVLPLARLETGEKPISMQLAERCSELGILTIIQKLLDVGMAGFGTSVDQVSRDRFRLLYLQPIRGALSGGGLAYSSDLLDVAYSIMIGERSFQNWTAYDVPQRSDPVMAFCLHDQDVLRPLLLDEARNSYPSETLPLLKFSSARIRGQKLKDGEEYNAHEFFHMNTVMQRLPNHFSDYRLEHEDENANRVSLSVDLPQFSKSITSSFPSQRRLLASASTATRDFMVIPASTAGVIVDDRTHPFLAQWLYPHSALDYFIHLLSTYIVGSNTVVHATQQRASVAEAAAIIEVFSDMMHASLKTSKARADGAVCPVELLEALGISKEHNQDTVGIVLAIFEEELIRLCQEPNNEGSLDLLVQCTHFIQALALIAPNRVWPWLARSQLLESDGNSGSLASILIGTEMVLGQYSFLIGCIELFSTLVDDAVERSVSRKSSSRALTRFNATVASESGISDKIMSSTLLVFGRTLASIYEGSLSWRYSRPEDQLHINIGISQTFANILHLAYSIDDSPNLNQKLTKIIGPVADYITELYLTKSENDLPTNPILSSLLSGAGLIKSSLLTSSAALLKRQTRSILQFSDILVRVAILLGKPWTHLEQQLFKATPLLARLYATSEVWRSPVVLLLETLVRGAVRTTENESQASKTAGQKMEPKEPPSLLGHLGPRTAKNFMVVLSQLDEPLRIVDNQKHVWNLLTAVVTCKQQWFALYLLTGNTPRDAMKSKSRTSTEESRSKALLSRALDALSHFDVDARNLPWHLYTAMLEFVTAAQNNWSWALGDLRERNDFIQQLLAFLKWMTKEAEPKADVAFLLRSHQNRFASLAAEILAMYLHNARQAGDVRSLNDIVPSLSYLEKTALELPAYNASLHSNLKQNIELQFPGVALTNLKRTTLYTASYGQSFFYDTRLAARLLGFDNRWSGPRPGLGFEGEVVKANLNLSLVDSQVRLLQSWKLLTLELSQSLSKDDRIVALLIGVIQACMDANAHSKLPEALFGQLMVSRADLAFALLKKLVEAKVKAAQARRLLGPIWNAIHASTVDFDNVFSSEHIDYYRSLLRILYLALHFHLAESSSESDMSFRSSFRGTVPASTNMSKEQPISNQLLDILSETVARGFRSLANQLHADPQSVSPSDFALLTAILQRIVVIPEMAMYQNQAALLFANSNTIRYATSLFSWSDKLAVQHNNIPDPIYGELSLLFILSLSSLRSLAETMAVEGILSQLNSANLMNYFRRSGGMGPLDSPRRMHSIWTSGILPLCLNLLFSVGAPIAAEIASFLNAFPAQLERSSNALNARFSPKISFGLASEIHSLALISSILDAYRTAGVREGIQPGDVVPLQWDKDNVREDIEGWLARRGALRERIVADGSEEMEDRILGEVEAAGACLGLGKGTGSSSPSE